MKRALEDSWKSIRPEIRKGNGSKTTARDGTNMGLTTAITVIFTWLIRDVAHVGMPAEVLVAFSTIIGYFVARKFRY